MIAYKFTKRCSGSVFIKNRGIAYKLYNIVLSYLLWVIIFSLTVEEIADAIEDSDDDPDYIQKDQISDTSSSSDDEPEPNILKQKHLKRKKSAVATIEDP